MPYIENRDRVELDAVLNCFTTFNVGEFNYIITKLCRKYIEKHGESYKNYNDLIGVLECAKLELYRRKISPYEDIKILSNGDV